VPARKKSQKAKKTTSTKKTKGAKKAATTKKTKSAKKAATTKKTKAAKKAKRTKARRRSARRSAKKALKTVQVGDAVRFPAETSNQIGRYDPVMVRGARGAEAIEGIVCSIRNVATGKLVSKTRGDLSGHVLEIMHNQTFQVHYASDRNTGGPRGPDNLRDNPTWLDVRRALRDMVASKQLVSAASAGLSEDPLRSLLDGWRVVKVKAEYVESAE
jgi:hypothetical protein